MSKLRVSDKLMRAVAQEAPQLYIPLPYHNYGHIKTAKTYFDEIYKKLTKQDVYINYHTGILATELHDAGYQVDHILQGYDTKEDYSAALAADLLESLGANEGIVEAVQSSIRATHYAAVPTNNVDKAVRMADIGNVFGDKITFMRNFLQLTQEAIIMGAPVADSFSAQCLRSKAFLEGYLKDPVIFTAEDGREVSHEPEFGRADRNILALGHLTMEAANEVMPNIRDFCPAHWLGRLLD